MNRKQTILYILGFLLLTGTGSSCGPDKKTDWKVTLRKDRKNPYDTYLAYQAVAYYFPDAATTPLYGTFSLSELNDKTSYNQGHSLLVLTCRSLFLSEAETEQLLLFCRRGNEVLLLSSMIDERLEEKLGCKLLSGEEYIPLDQYNKGSDNRSALQLAALPGQQFGFYGRNISGYLEVRKNTDTSVSWEKGDAVYIEKVPAILGTAKGKPDFVQYSIGEGHLTIHATPLVFSNYFLLQPGNRAYMDAVWRSIPGSISNVYWSGFMNRTPNDSSFGILWRHPATRWFLIISCGTLLLYILFQQKRRQRLVPVIPPVSNSSVAFAETVGMLYFNKGDNTNLAHKMVQHFLEWTRNHYYLNTNLINDTFVTQLTLKSGLPETLARELTDSIHELRTSNARTSDEQLFRLYSMIQQYYKTT